MPVRAVIFDFGGVLCFHPSPQKVARAARFCGISPQRFLQAFWGPHRVEYDAGRLDSAGFWQEASRRADIAFEPAALPELVRMEVDFWSDFDQRVFAWVRRLRIQGIRTAVLSNLPRPLGEALKRAPGFLDPFDHITFSYELGCVKPERAIYEHAWHGLSIAPGEALFLDDRPENVEGARKAGLHADLYPSWQDFWAQKPEERYSLPLPS
jgi:putative hydrolase of the HAD superfamily